MKKEILILCILVLCSSLVNAVTFFQDAASSYVTYSTCTGASCSASISEDYKGDDSDWSTYSYLSYSNIGYPVRDGFNGVGEFNYYWYYPNYYHSDYYELSKLRMKDVFYLDTNNLNLDLPSNCVAFRNENNLIIRWKFTLTRTSSTAADINRIIYCCDGTGTTYGSCSSWYSLSSVSHDNMQYSLVGDYNTLYEAGLNYTVECVTSGDCSAGYTCTNYVCVDDTPPSIGAPSVSSGNTYNNGTALVYAPSVTFRSSVSDSGSGIDTSSCKAKIGSGSFSSSGVTYSSGYCYYTHSGTTSPFNITFQVADLNGNSVNSSISSNYYYDGTVPVTSPSATSGGAAYTYNTWSNASVNNTLSCQDTGGAGVLGIYYCTDITNTCTPSTLYSSPVIVSTEGISYLRYFCKDNVQNTETTKNSTIKIDTVAPTTGVPTFNSGIRSGNYYRGNISLKSSISDATSGLNLSSCAINFSNGDGWIGSSDGITTDGNNCYFPNLDWFLWDGTNYLFAEYWLPNRDFNVTFRIRDNSTNLATSATTQMLYDNTAPGVSILFPSNQWYNYMPTINYTVFDVGVGIANCWWTNDSGATNISLSSGRFCYQETANVSTSCGGLDSGKYYFAFNSIYPSTFELYDGDWYTEAYESLESSTGYMYVNYTKPIGALNTSLWRIKSTNTPVNLSILGSCWNYDPNKIILRIKDRAFVGTTYECYSGSWQSLGTSSYPIYEEAMWWNMSGCTNITGITWPQGLNTVTIYSNDSLGSLNSSTVSFNVATLGPVVSIIFPVYDGQMISYTNFGINYTYINSTPIDQCWWTNNSGVTNMTLAGCQNISAREWSTIPNNNVTIYINDTVSNVGFATRLFEVFINSIPTLDHTLSSQVLTHNLQNLSLNASCTDALNYTLTYYSNNSIISINSTTGIIFDNPLIADVGTYSINITCGNRYNNVSQVFNYTILNTAPSLATVSFYPIPNFGELNLTLNFTTSDAESDTIYNYTKWWLNGTYMSEWDNKLTILEGNFSETDTIIAQLIIGDLKNNATAVNVSMRFGDIDPPTVYNVRSSNSLFYRYDIATLYISCTDTISSIDYAVFYYTDPEFNTFEIRQYRASGDVYNKSISLSTVGFWQFTRADCIDSAGNVGSNTTLGISLTVSARDAGAGDTGGGGSITQPNTLNLSLELANLGVCNNNAICEGNESLRSCPNDCSVDLDSLLCLPQSQNCNWKQTWFISVLSWFLLGTILVGYLIIQKNKRLRQYPKNI